MGGGAAMRSAAKVAGIGGFHGGLGGGENPVAAAAREATRSVASVFSSSSSDGLKQTIAISKDNKANYSVQKPYLEIDDWELAGVEDELFMEAGEPMPRVVFGGAPTVQEAKQAASELNDALETTYLFPSTTNKLTGSLVSAQAHELPLLSDSEHAESKPCIARETAVTLSAPNQAIQAFRLFHESPAARTVVASIACDPNVWNAVMQNEEVVDYLQSHKTSVALPDMDSTVNDMFACSEMQSPQAAKCPEEASESEEPASAKGFMDYVEEIKHKITVTVVDMMNSLSDTFQSLFGFPAKPECYVNPDGTAGIWGEKATIGASLMGLAVMVIVVVVLKRN